MQMATMTTFPGPCRKVALLPDRGFVRQKRYRRASRDHYEQYTSVYLKDIAKVITSYTSQHMPKPVFGKNLIHSK